METMISERAVQAENCLLTSKLLKPSAYIDFKFAMNVNTNANSHKPYYPQVAYLPVFTQHSPKYLAVKASQDLSLLQILGDDHLSVVHSLAFDELKPNEGFFPVSFEFIPGTNAEKSSLLVAYENGCLVNLDFLKKDIFAVINPQPASITHKVVSQIIVDSWNPREVLTIFEDSSMMRYNLDYPESQFYLDKFSKFDEKTNFNPKLNKFIYKHKENDFIEQKRNFDLIMSEMNYFACINKQKAMPLPAKLTDLSSQVQIDDKGPKNPLAFYKFNCNFISDVSICFSPFFEKINAKPHKTKSFDLGVFAYVGFDGYLRVFDYYWFTPLFSYKSNFGGYSHICFSPKGDLIGLTGHDDSVTIIDLASFRTLYIEGHRSFTTKVKISEPEPNIIRILASGLDGFITLSEFDKRIFMLEEDNNTRRTESESKFPKRISFKEQQVLSIKPNFFLKVSNDGIGSFDLFSKFLFINCYDGTVGVWNFEPGGEKTEEQTKNSTAFTNPNTKGGPSMIADIPVEKQGVKETVEDCQEDSENEKDETFFKGKTLDEVSTNSISTANVAS